MSFPHDKEAARGHLHTPQTSHQGRVPCHMLRGQLDGRASRTVGLTAPVVFSVMEHFVHELVWAMGCPDIWLNIILGVCEGLFLGEIDIGVGRLSQADSPLGVGGSCPILQGLKGTEGVRASALSVGHTLGSSGSAAC